MIYIYIYIYIYPYNRSYSMVFLIFCAITLNDMIDKRRGVVCSLVCHDLTGNATNTQGITNP